VTGRLGGKEFLIKVATYLLFRRIFKMNTEGILKSIVSVYSDFQILDQDI
jgi:hypothetical protein